VTTGGEATTGGEVTTSGLALEVPEPAKIPPRLSKPTKAATTAAISASPSARRRVLVDVSVVSPSQDGTVVEWGS
jgi:hypothetical protein